MLQIDESRRADFEEITTHPFFSDLNTAEVLNLRGKGTGTSDISGEFLPTQYVQSYHPR